MNPNASLDRSDGEEDVEENVKARYGSAIGALMYLMIGTRPGIAFALATLSGFLVCPRSHQQAALQRLLRYLKATLRLQITYRQGNLIGYTDADFGGTVVTEGHARRPATSLSWLEDRSAGLLETRGKSLRRLPMPTPPVAPHFPLRDRFVPRTSDSHHGGQSVRDCPVTQS